MRPPAVFVRSRRALDQLGAWDGVQANASIDDSVTRASQAINAQLEKDLGLSGDRLLEGKPDVLSVFASQAALGAGHR